MDPAKKPYFTGSGHPVFFPLLPMTNAIESPDYHDRDWNCVPYNWVCTHDSRQRGVSVSADIIVKFSPSIVDLKDDNDDAAAVGDSFQNNAIGGHACSHATTTPNPTK